MKKIISIVPRWLPAFFFMVVIFTFSSQPSDELPSFADWDYVIKKMGHAVGYGLLSLSYLHFLKYDKKRIWLAWLMAVAYSVTDEFHQSFVPGRHASFADILVFDNLGVVFALLLYCSPWSSRRSRLNHYGPGE
jgi:VanZ family protein